MSKAPQANLDQQLSAVRSRWIVRDGVLALGWTILGIVPVCLVLGWLDYRLDFSHPVRVIELVGLLAWSIWLILRFIVPAAVRHRDAYNAALRIESVRHQFGGRLVSRVEFRGAAGRSPRLAKGLSPSLADAMCERIERDAARLTLTDAIDLSPIRRPAAAAGLALVLLCVVILARPTLAALWIQRTLLPFSDAGWPRRTQITGLEPQYRIRRGDSVRITGSAVGEVPWTGELEWRPAGDAPSKTRSTGHTTFDVEPDGTFAVRIGPLLEPIKFSIEVGDAGIEHVRVDVVVPPELASIEAVYHYPEFTGRQPDRVQSGDVRALVGTRVDLTLNADRPSQRMELAFSGGAGERIEPVTLASERQGRCSFAVGARGRFQVRLWDAYGFSTDSPATFVIEPIDNELPTVRLTRPGSEHTVTPATQLRLRFEAADDFGVTGATIRWQTQVADGSDMLPRTGSVSIPVGPPRKDLTGPYIWDLANADFQTGDRIEYHVEVRDAGQHLTDQKVGLSARYVLRVIDPETLRQSLEARMRDALAELDRITQQQQAGRDGVEIAIVSHPSTGEPVMPADLRRLQIEQNRQTRIRRQAGRLAGRLRQVADELRDSFLADPDRIEDLYLLADGLAQLATGPMGQAVEQLKQARAALAEFSSLPYTGGD